MWPDVLGFSHVGAATLEHRTLCPPKGRRRIDQRGIGWTGLPIELIERPRGQRGLREGFHSLCGAASQAFRETIPSRCERFQGKLVEAVDLGFQVHPFMVLAGMPVPQALVWVTREP